MEAIANLHDDLAQSGELGFGEDQGIPARGWGNPLREII
jgi:hypothetical protein